MSRFLLTLATDVHRVLKRFSRSEVKGRGVTFTIVFTVMAEACILTACPQSSLVTGGRVLMLDYFYWPVGVQGTRDCSFSLVNGTSVIGYLLMIG